MSRIQRRLSACRADGKTALTTFITAGDPVLEATVPALHGLVRGGADILELGVPFSDPEAEGPSIQRSSQRALDNRVTLADVMQFAADFRSTDAATPIVLMGYLNSIMRMGYEDFARAAHDAGVDGVIVVNLPPEEAQPLQTALEKHHIDLIFLVAPTTTRERASFIARRCSGFVYYVSLKGVTGADHIHTSSVEEKVAALREVCELPIQVGFGIKNAASAKAIARVADGVVVGSMLVDIMGELAGNPAAIPDALETQIRGLRDAIDAS